MIKNKPIKTQNKNDDIREILFRGTVELWDKFKPTNQSHLILNPFSQITKYVNLGKVLLGARVRIQNTDDQAPKSVFHTSCHNMLCD